MASTSCRSAIGLAERTTVAVKPRSTSVRPRRSAAGRSAAVSASSPKAPGSHTVSSGDDEAPAA